MITPTTAAFSKWTFRDTPQNELKSVVCKTPVILFKHQCVQIILMTFHQAAEQSKCKCNRQVIKAYETGNKSPWPQLSGILDNTYQSRLIHTSLTEWICSFLWMLGKSHPLTIPEFMAMKIIGVIGLDNWNKWKSRPFRIFRKNVFRMRTLHWLYPQRLYYINLKLFDVKLWFEL